MHVSYVKAINGLVVRAFRFQLDVEGRCVSMFVAQCYEVFDGCFIVKLHEYVDSLAVVYEHGCYDLADVIHSCNATGWVVGMV